MKNVLLAAVVLAALAACRSQPKTAEPAPDYDGARQRSESSHSSLDKQ